MPSIPGHQCRKPSPENDEEDIRRLREWVEKGEAWAQCMMGTSYRDGTDGLKQSYVMARLLFKKAVAQGDPAAMYDLAFLYAEGKGVVQSFEKAVELYTTAVEQGHAGATYNLANMYRGGRGVVQSFKKAAEFYTMAAEQGHVTTMYNLATLYDEGEGLDQSDGKAIQYYTMAAELGQVNAMFNLAPMYKNGQGVPQSNNTAREWFTKARDAGDKEAIEELRELDAQEGQPAATTTTTGTTPTSASSSPSLICCSSCNTPQPVDRHLKNAWAAARCNILQQGVSTSALESRRAQTRVQTIEKKERTHTKGSSSRQTKQIKIKLPATFNF